MQGFPTLTYIQPRSKGLKANENPEDREFEDLKRWISKSVQKANKEIQEEIEKEKMRSQFSDSEKEAVLIGDVTTLEGQLTNLAEGLSRMELRLEGYQRDTENQNEKQTGQF